MSLCQQNKMSMPTQWNESMPMKIKWVYANENKISSLYQHNKMSLCQHNEMSLCQRK